MSSPIPPDPYEALGVAKDSDLTAVRTAHRKLALKHHPDRIKDEAEREKGKVEFQKIQQAYDILSDPEKRSRYDDKVKLAELRREAMMREPMNRQHVYPMRPAPPTSMPREFRDGTYFEERVPSGSYFDVHEQYDDPIPRASARKYDDFERRYAARPPPVERKPSSSSKWDKPAGDMSFNMAFKLKKHAAQAKEKVRDNKAKEKETQSAKAKTRDKDERRDRSDKESRRAFVVDVDSSDSEDYFQQSPKQAPSSPRSNKKPESRRGGPERRGSHRESTGDTNYNDSWEDRHKDASNYIASSTRDRPAFSRTESDAHRYWDGDDYVYGRRSGSDSDKRPVSSRKLSHDVGGSKARPRPTMQTQASAPPFLEEREPRPARPTRSPSSREKDQDSPREVPSINRAHTMPHVSSRKDNAPSKSSNLRHAETQDSGYGSSSPHTPEMPEHSPLRPEQARQSSTKYQIVEPVMEEEDSRGHRTILVEEEDRHRRFSSPPRERERRDRTDRSSRTERPRLNTENRSRTSRPSSTQLPSDVRPSNMRTESSRHVPSSPRESPSVSRENSGRGKLFGEVGTDDRESSGYSRRYAPETISTSPRIDPDRVNHGPYRRRDQDDRDHLPGSKYRDELRQPNAGRRASAY